MMQSLFIAKFIFFLLYLWILSTGFLLAPPPSPTQGTSLLSNSSPFFAGVAAVDSRLVSLGSCVSSHSQCIHHTVSRPIFQKPNKTFCHDSVQNTLRSSVAEEQSHAGLGDGITWSGWKEGV